MRSVSIARVPAYVAAAILLGIVGSINVVSAAPQSTPAAATVGIPHQNAPAPTPPPGAAAMLAKEKPLTVGVMAPDFTALDRSGKTVRLSEYKGQIVVLDFWASWCQPCQTSLPRTDHVASRFKPGNIVVLAINAWDTSDAFQRWIAARKAKFSRTSFVRDASPGGWQIAHKYGVPGIPIQFVIDRDGKIACVLRGDSTPIESSAALSRAIKACVAQKNSKN